MKPFRFLRQWIAGSLLVVSVAGCSNMQEEKRQVSLIPLPASWEQTGGTVWRRTFQQIED